MAIIYLKYNTETNTCEVLETPIDIQNAKRIFSSEEIINFAKEHFQVEKEKDVRRLSARYFRIITSAILKEHLKLPNKTIAELLGYSEKSNSSNVVGRNCRLVLRDQDAVYYPMYIQFKRKLWGNLDN